MSDQKLGVVLMSFGSASDEADVPAYLDRVRRGHPVAPALVADLQMRYRVVGGSPLIRITTEQSAALEARLKGAGVDARVVPGMLNSEPYIAAAVADLRAAGATRLVAIPMAPQTSPHTQLYVTALDAIRSMGVEILMAGEWYQDPAFVELLAINLASALATLGPDERAAAQILFTAHSLPVRVPGAADYQARIVATAEAVATHAGLAAGTWRCVFQSRSGAAADWLGPDILDVTDELVAAGATAVVAAPVQFLADHLEVLYDLDVQVKERAEAAGIAYRRSPSANASEAFVAILASVVERALEGVVAGAVPVG